MMDTVPPGRRLVVWRKNYLNAGKRKTIRTICEVLRDLYRDAHARKDPVSMQRIEEAHDMAKRMQYKLMEYAGKNVDVHDKVYLLIDPEEGMVWLDHNEMKAKQTVTAHE